MKVYYFQHVPFEGLGMIAAWAAERVHTVEKTALYEPNHHLPSIVEYDALIVMGGSMGVYDEAEYPWLIAEKKHIRSAIDAGKPVLGICLGAQLIASALGAKVAPHTHKEIGWFPIAITDEAAEHPILSGLNQAMKVFHWHGDRLEIPNGAIHLMCSEACDNQAFLYGDNVLGVQFHLEMDEAAIISMINACGHELIESAWIQSRALILEETKKRDTRQSLYNLLDAWLAVRV